MITRELQSNMSILNSFKQTGKTETNDFRSKFNSVFTNADFKFKATNQFESKGPQEFYDQEQSNKATFNNQSALKSKIGLESSQKKEAVEPLEKKREVSISNDKVVKKVSETQNKPEDNSVAEIDDVKKVDQVDETDEVSKVDETSKADEANAVDELETKEEFLKKMGITEDELNNIMELLNVDLETLQQMVSIEVITPIMIQEIGTTISQIEIASVLNENENLDQKLLETLKQQLSQLESILNKVLSEVKETVGQSSAVDHETFKTELIQKIQEMIEKTEVKVTPEQPTEEVQSKDSIVGKIVEAMTATSGTEKPLQSTEKLAVESVPTESVKTEALKVNSDSSGSMNKNDSEEGDDVSTHVSVNAQGDIVVEKESSESNFIIDQIAIKQPNALTNGTQNQSPIINRSDVFNQIMDSIKTNIKLDDSGSHMLMKLQPEQLGNVELKISIHKGTVLAEFNVENEMVKATVEANLEDLKSSLSQKGYNVSQINVSVDTGKKEANQEFQSSRNSNNRKQIKLDAVDELAEELFLNSAYHKDLRAPSTINYFA